MRQFPLSLALVLSLAAVLAACGEVATEAPKIAPALVVKPQLAAPLVESYPGEVRARIEPELAFRIGGKVVKRLVEIGDPVRKGQVLAELDPQDVRLQLEATRAQVAAAQANAQLAKTERERYQTLLGRNLVSRSQFDNADNAYRSAAATLQRAQAELKVASNQTDYATLRATADGVIAQRRVEVGQVVAAGQVVYTLAADGEREVVISLPEGQVERVRLGQPVQVQLWSQPGVMLEGAIRELAPAADPRSRTFATRVSFKQGQTNVELGQSAQVFIQTSAQAVLAVPMSAVTAEKGQAYVWVVDPHNRSVQARMITPGPYGQQMVPVLEGLTEQDWIVAAGAHVMQAGKVIRPVDRDNRDLDLTDKE